MTTPWTIIASNGALLAFLIGLYTTVGRERKSPYVLNHVFRVFGICLLSAIAALVSTLYPHRNIAINFGVAFLLIAFTYSFWNVYTLHVRFTHFIGKIEFRYLPVIRQLRHWRKNSKIGPTWEHTSEVLSEEQHSQIIAEISSLNCQIDVRGDGDHYCITISSGHHSNSTDILAKLSAIFFKHSLPVQYLTASRHPYEFVERLNKDGESGLFKTTKALQNLLVVIDAYSPHFAFLDSIYPHKTRLVKSLGVPVIQAGNSFAGLHSASAKAFNITKQKSKSNNNQQRPPALVIYEDVFALSDLESVEQYRLFVRHVLPSERLWGGMFTVFIESYITNADWSLLQSYGSIAIDMTKPGAEVK